MKTKGKRNPQTKRSGVRPSPLPSKKKLPPSLLPTKIPFAASPLPILLSLSSPLPPSSKSVANLMASLCFLFVLLFCCFGFGFFYQNHKPVNAARNLVLRLGVFGLKRGKGFKGPSARLSHQRAHLTLKMILRILTTIGGVP